MLQVYEKGHNSEILQVETIDKVSYYRAVVQKLINKEMWIWLYDRQIHYIDSINTVCCADNSIDYLCYMDSNVGWAISYHRCF